MSPNPFSVVAPFMGRFWGRISSSFSAIIPTALLFSLLFYPHLISAAPDGTTSAEFLKVGAGARAQAMGTAQTALADDVFAIHLNPAGLGSIRSGEVAMEHNKLFEGINRNMVAGALPTRSGVWGLAYNRLSVDSFSGYDADGSPTTDLSSGGDALGLAWGKNFRADATGTNGLLGGVGFKMIREETANISKSAFAADLGLLYRPWVGKDWFRRMSFGAAIRQLGSGIKYDSESAPLPTEVSGGVGYSQFLSGDILTLGLDLTQTAGEGSSVSAGAEYWLRNLIALRAGYHTANADGAGVRAGAGFRLNHVQIDYAWTAQGKDLEAAHLFTLTYRFGPPAPAPGAAADLYLNYVQQGKRWMSEGVYDRAILDFQHALEIRPRDEEVMKLLMDCGRKLENPE